MALLRALSDAFAGLVRRAPAGLRRALVWGLSGRLVVAGIFAAMPRRLRQAAGSGFDLLVRWDVEGERPRFLQVREGSCSVGREADREPDITLGLDRLTLLELATGAANGPQLFLSGRIKLAGDMMLAQRLTSMFVVPGAA